MAQQFIFTMLGLNRYYGQKHVLKDIGLCFFPGAKIGIVGENGSGKSTVLRIMAGLDKDFDGKAELSAGYRSLMVAQEPALEEDKTVRQNLAPAFAGTTALLEEYNKVADRLAEQLSEAEMEAAMKRMADLQDKLDSTGGWDLDRKIAQASEALCLPDDERVVRTLSGGERRRVALCKALLERPDLLLLDEPTNHLDAETIDWLEMQLREYPGTVIIVTHDRYFLDNVTQWILELEGGYGIPFKGNYSSWLEQKLAKFAGEEKKDSPRRRSLERELAWIRMSSKARHDLSRSRLAEYEQLLAREKAGREEGFGIQIAPAPDLGDLVVEFKGVSKGFGGNVLIKELDFKLPKAALAGVIGPNGAGKTTLLRMILGEEKPDAGQVIIGPTARLACVRQERDLNPELSVLDEISGGASEIRLGSRTMPARQYLARFGFKGADQGKTVAALSGGERNRAQLAKVLKMGGNVLLLDEPTNDLDVNTLRLLEEALLAFSGCALIISHDRFFLNRVCTHLLVFEGEGKVRWFEGNYEEYEQWRMKELGSRLFENRRNRYRKLVRK